MKIISQLLLIVTAVFALSACVDADSPAPQQGSKGADKATNVQQ